MHVCWCEHTVHIFRCDEMFGRWCLEKIVSCFQLKLERLEGSCALQVKYFSEMEAPLKPAAKGTVVTFECCELQ